MGFKTKELLLMKILLINPKFPPSYWGQEYNSDITGYSYVFPPLGLATLAALSGDHEVEILDENIEEIDFEYAKAFDIIGLTGYMIQSDREFQIADKLREIGSFIVIGGPNAYLIDNEARQHCDVLIKGEAERIWPEFLNDFENNSWKKIYEEKNQIEMIESPIPRYDLLKLDRYAAAILQTARGCPFSCDFCDIIVMYGKKVRTKSIEKVIEEIKLLFKLGKFAIFIADDNFVGNKRHAKALVKAIRDYNSSIGNQLTFHTQVTIDLAKDDELMQLFYEARFEKVFIGIETPRLSSLKDANKGQNLKRDLIEDIQKIQSHNLFVMAGMIVGFDSDDPDIFDEQKNFLMEAGIPIIMLGTLQAIPHTPLYNRILEENRLIDIWSGNNVSSSNILPKNMTYEELLIGYNRIISDLYTFENFSKRLIKNINLFHKKKKLKIRFSINLKDITIFSKTVFHSLKKWKQFSTLFKISKAILTTTPSHFAQVISLYLNFIHMEKYLEHHLANEEEIRDFADHIKLVKPKSKENISFFESKKLVEK